MRKYVRDQLSEIISTVSEGIEYAVTASPKEGAIMLYDCYDAITVVSDTLKESLTLKRYTEYDLLLENVKTMIHELNGNLSNRDTATNYLPQKINNQIQNIKRSLMNEPEVKLEVAFLPYSASMWDSLESIWKAAKEDSRCECYVVPIPYFDRNPDLSLGKLHYEGNSFPKDVPILNYNHYDVSIRKPDIIYIHNPYDGNNYVTSVHPNYYSDELKKHTEMLVYVPYFVTNGLYPESHCNFPVLRNVDKVIVQSDQIKQQHLSYISPEKITALGSPKIDKVLFYEKHQHDIPSAWKKIIGNKKVVLINISLTSLLIYGSSVLEKLKYVFSCFEERNDVVLLWRPHPLSGNTMSSMRPQLLHEYYKFENEYKNKPFVIFDDTPNVERAIAISDAYFGDGTSSLVPMYGVTGKPIMVQDIIFSREPTEDEIVSVWFGSAEFDEEYAWVTNGSYNGLCKVNLRTGQTEFIAEIPNEKKDGHYLYSNIHRVDNKIILTPVFAKEIAIYDLDTGGFEKIPIDIEKPSFANNFLKAIKYNDYIFFTPFMFEAIIRYDAKTGEVKYFKNWYNKLKPYINNTDKPIFANGICVRNNSLLMPFSQDNIVMEFDMLTSETKIHKVGKGGNNYWDMTFDGVDYWLIQHESENSETIVRWNYESGETIEYSIFPSGFVNEQKNFNEIVYCGEYLLAFPRFSNMIIKINVETGEMSEFKTGKGYKEGERKSIYYNLKNNYYFAKFYKGDYVIAMSMYDNSLLKINIKTEEVTKINIKLTKNDIDSYISFKNDYMSTQSAARDYYYIESKYLTLNKLLEYITSDNYMVDYNQIEAYKKIINNSDGTSGKKIHDYIIKFIN